MLAVIYSMKRTLLLLLLLLGFIFQGFTQVNSKHVRVNGYTRKDGTYVAPHYRTAPNSTNRDNFSTRGNTNPYTGRAGYIPRDNKPLYKSSTTNSSSSKKAYYYPQPTKSVKKSEAPTFKNYNTSYKTVKISKSKFQRKWIKKRLNKLAKSSLRKDKNYSLKLKSYSKRQERKLRRSKNVRLYQLTDGWYDVNFATTVDIRKKSKNIFIKRQILIENGEAKKYIGAENMIFDIHEFFLDRNNYKMKIVYPDSEVSKVYGDIFLYETKPLKRKPNYELPSIVYFYTSNDNQGGPISVTIESNTKSYWGGYMDKYWNTTPNCSTTEDIIKFYLPTGDYSYYAENNNGLWKDDIAIYNDCVGINLGSN